MNIPLARNPPAWVMLALGLTLTAIASQRIKDDIERHATDDFAEIANELTLRVEEQLRSLDQPESHYEALKAYLMMYDPQRFDAGALKAHIEADWDVRLGREMTTEQRERLTASTK